MSAQEIETVVIRPYQFEKRLSVERPLGLGHPYHSVHPSSSHQHHHSPSNSHAKPNPPRPHNTRGIGTIQAGYKSTLLSLDTSSFSTTTAGWDLSLDDVVETTALVRGGRFLVALHDRHWLSCWDLWGSAANPESDSAKAEGEAEGRKEEGEVRVQCESIGTWKCESRVLRILAQQSADDANTLVIAVYCQTEADAL